MHTLRRGISSCPWTQISFKAFLVYTSFVGFCLVLQETARLHPENWRHLDASAAAPRAALVSPLGKSAAKPAPIQKHHTEKYFVKKTFSFVFQCFSNELLAGACKNCTLFESLSTKFCDGTTFFFWCGHRTRLASAALDIFDSNFRAMKSGFFNASKGTFIDLPSALDVACRVRMALKPAKSKRKHFDSPKATEKLARAAIAKQSVLTVSRIYHSKQVWSINVHVEGRSVWSMGVVLQGFWTFHFRWNAQLDHVSEVLELRFLKFARSLCPPHGRRKHIILFWRLHDLHTGNSKKMLKN